MKRFVFLVILFLAFVVVQAQSQKSTAQPNEQSKVTREYDDNGNLIRFDSTYVKSWSSDSTLNRADIDQLQKQMEEMFGGSFGEDSGSFIGGPFPGSEKEFFKQFEQQFGDSTGELPGFQNSFHDFEELHEQMMQRFGQFFRNDSVQFQNDTVPGQMHFDFFGDPKEFERIQKEFEKHFEQLKKENNSSTKIDT